MASELIQSTPLVGHPAVDRTGIVVVSVLRIVLVSHALSGGSLAKMAVAPPSLSRIVAVNPLTSISALIGLLMHLSLPPMLSHGRRTEPAMDGWVTKS